MSRFHGWDLALNHSGLVELDEAGRVTWFRYVTTKPTQAKEKWGGVMLKVDKRKEDRHRFMLDRLIWWEAYFKAVMAERRPSHVAVEDYALMAQSNSVYQIGELGGTARLQVLRGGALLRLHDPVSAKMYIAHSGAATPTEMEEAVYKRWPQTHVWAGLPEEARLDLIVAYSLARMLLDEINLRSGKLSMSSLDAKEIQVYNRVTKANPTSLLGREFISL